MNAIKSIDSTTQADFVELFNPGNFKAQKGTLMAGQTYDVQENPALDLTRTTVQEQTRIYCKAGPNDFNWGSPLHRVLTNAEH